MFTGEIANLASFWCAGIARGRLATDEGVDMAQSACAVAGGADGKGMKVVDCID